MPNKTKAACLGLGIAAGALLGAEFPEAAISNGPIEVKFYLPDAQRGYYRATRFEWSGVIHSLKYQGHEYFGQWFEKYDPKIHDAIQGPVESNDSNLGYDQAKPGETFVRVGVGVVRKPEEEKYQIFRTYDIVDPGKWRVRQGSGWIEFVQQVKDASGYAFEYSKKFRLAKGKPEMTIEHRLKNKGKLPISMSQYNHNFFVMDGRPTGPDAVVRFPFEPKALVDMSGKAEIRGKDLVHLREFAAGGQDHLMAYFDGFGSTAADYDLRMEHRGAGIGVRIRGDQPIVRLPYWSIRTTFCPEPYIKLSAQPGGQANWSIQYEFYTLK